MGRHSKKSVTTRSAGRTCISLQRWVPSTNILAVPWPPLRKLLGWEKSRMRSCSWPGVLAREFITNLINNDDSEKRPRKCYEEMIWLVE